MLHSTAVCTWPVTDARTSILCNTLVVVVVSLWIFTSESVLECTLLERLSRAPRDRPPQRNRAVPAPHAHRSSAKERAPTK